jgi:hypothetical protein
MLEYKPGNNAILNVQIGRKSASHHLGGKLFQRPTSALFLTLGLFFGTIQHSPLSPSLDTIRILVTLQSAFPPCFRSFITSIPIVSILSCHTFLSPIAYILNCTVYNEHPVYLIYPGCLNHYFDISPVIQPHASRIAPIGPASRRIRYPFPRIYSFTVEKRQYMFLSKRNLYSQSLKDPLMGFKSGVCAGKKRI